MKVSAALSTRVCRQCSIAPPHRREKNDRYFPTFSCRRHSYLANRDEPPVIDRNRRKMMSRIVTALLVLSIMVGASGAAMAKGVRSPHINQVQRNQQHRIGQGVESGSLTPGETVRLER